MLENLRASSSDKGCYMNVLMVSNYPSDTGYAWWLMEHFWLLFNDFVNENGGRAYLAYPKITKTNDLISKSGINLVELDMRPSTLRACLKLCKFIFQKKISVIYFTDRSYFSFIYLLYRFFGVKIIIVHDHTPGDRPPIKGVKGALKLLRNRLPFVTANSVFNVSPLMKTRAIENGRIPSRKCYVVQNGVKYKEPLLTRAEIRKKLGIDEARVVSISSGRLHSYKRFDLIVDAIKIQEQPLRRRRALFLFVGDGPARQDLTKKINDLGLSDMVWILGERNDVPDLLNMSDLAIHASLGEGFSLSIIEFMVHHLPVIVPNKPSVCQAVGHMNNGLIFESGSPEELSQCIVNLVSDKALRDELGGNAKQKVLSCYTLESTSRAFLKALKTTLYGK